VRIIKLTLQPIVENAIFSGIEPSGRTGLIKIHAFARNGILYVTVTDNGIGISPDNIKKLLTDTSRITKSNMSGIGLPNVDRRLKLVYGEDYGITIESVLDEYTKITISLPLEVE
ncbi:MAG: ATP-binding protein, partial [Hungatella sp.]